MFKNLVVGSFHFFKWKRWKQAHFEETDHILVLGLASLFWREVTHKLPTNYHTQTPYLPYLPYLPYFSSHLFALAHTVTCHVNNVVRRTNPTTSTPTSTTDRNTAMKIMMNIMPRIIKSDIIILIVNQLKDEVNTVPSGGSWNCCSS